MTNKISPAAHLKSGIQLPSKQQPRGEPEETRGRNTLVCGGEAGGVGSCFCAEVCSSIAAQPNSGLAQCLWLGRVSKNLK